jgi:hypothetical protein
VSEGQNGLCTWRVASAASQTRWQDCLSDTGVPSSARSAAKHLARESALACPTFGPFSARLGPESPA